MSIVAEFNIPSEAVPGGETLKELSDATIQLERIVPSTDEVLPFFWVFNADPTTFRERAQTEPQIADVTVLAETAHGALFRAEWTPDAELINGIKTLKATIIEAEGTASGWWFQVRADDRERLAAFQDIFTSQGVSIEVRRIYNFAEIAETGRPLTPQQREMLVAAYERGYYEQPRQVTQEELGDEFGITGRAVSNRLRRGTRNLISSNLLESPDRNHS